jgi:tetratricopeptide (TPR) repeat protein
MTVKPVPDNPDAMRAAIAEGIGDILGVMREAGTKAACRLFSDDELEFFYSIGYVSYTQSKFDEALAIFQRLARYRPAEPRYLKALAACHEALGDIKAARNAYALVMCVAPDDGDAANRFERCEAMLERQGLSG